MEESLTTRRCTAVAHSTGARCARAPIPGGNVCANHGGKAPQTIAAARARLLEAVEPAVARLLRFIVAPPGLCDACGRSDDTGAIVSAIRTVLDRCGLGPTATVQVAPADRPYEDLSLAELADRAEDLARRCRASADDEAASALPEAADAVLINDGASSRD